MSIEASHKRALDSVHSNEMLHDMQIADMYLTMIPSS